MPLLGAQCSTSREQAVDHQTPSQEKQVKATSRALLLRRALRLPRCRGLFLGPVARHGRLDFLGAGRYSRQSVRVFSRTDRVLVLGGSVLFGQHIARCLEILLGPGHPPLPAHLDDPREDEEQEEAPHQRIAAHQPAIVCLREIKIGGGVHLNQQRGIARRQHAQEDAAAEEEHAVVLLDAPVAEPEALRQHDLERRQEAADAALPAGGVLLAVGQGRGGDVRQHDAGVQGRDQEEEEGDLEGHADAAHVAGHAAQEQADGLAQHETALQLPEDGGALHGRDELACDGVDDEDVAGGPAQDRDELGGLDDGDARGAAGQDAEDLRAGADGGDEGLQDEGEAGPPFLDHPARHEEVERPAKGGAHAQEGELGRGAGGDLVHGAAVAGAGVGRVGFVVDVALHQVEDVEDGDLGEGEAEGDDEAGEEDLEGVGRAEDAGEPGGLLGVDYALVAIITTGTTHCTVASSGIDAIAIAIAIGGADGSVLVVLTSGTVQERRRLVSLVSVVCGHGDGKNVVPVPSLCASNRGERIYGEEGWEMRSKE